MPGIPPCQEGELHGGSAQPYPSVGSRLLVLLSGPNASSLPDASSPPVMPLEDL